MEIWKDIQGYEGLYQVSNLGNVRSVRDCRTRELSLINTRNGYLAVNLYKNGQMKRFLVHRLVAIRFVPGYRKNLVTNHLNEVKTDNRAENLEWCTQQENTVYGTGLSRSVKGHEKKVAQIDSAGNVVKVWESAAKAEEEGFDHSHIAKACMGRYKTHNGYRWQYVTENNGSREAALPKTQTGDNPKKRKSRRREPPKQTQEE